MYRHGRIAFVALLALVASACSSGQKEQQPEVEVKRPEGPPVVIPSTLGGAPDIDISLEGSITQYTRATRTHYAHPDISLDGELMAYAATTDGPNPQIYLQRKNQMAVAQLTFGKSANIQPAISPDSTEIAFCTNAGGDGSTYRIMIKPVSSSGGYGEPVSPEGFTSMSPSWSPDGRKVCFASKRNGYDMPWEIKIYDRDTTKLHTICLGQDPEWSPDGARIAFQRPDANRPGYTAVYTIRTNGDENTFVAGSDDWGAITPTWMGSEWILFATVNKSLASRTRNNNVMLNADDIYMVKRDGSQLRQVTSHRMADWDPCYDQANKEIIYVSNREGVQNIFGVQSHVSDVWGYHTSMGGGH